MNSARLRARAKARRAYWLGGGGLNDPENLPYDKDPMAEKVRDTEDKQMLGTEEMGTEGLYPGDEAKKKEVGRDGLNLSKAQLQDRALKRRAYFLGGGGINEPSPGKYPYDKDPMAENVRNNEDKHLQGIYDMGGTDGAVPGDMEIKKKLLRAKLRAKFTKVADSSDNLRKDASRWDVYAGDKLVLTATGEEIFGDKLNTNWDYLSSREYGKDVIKYIREEGLERVAYLLKGAQPPADPMAGVPGGGEAMPPMDMGATPEAGPTPEEALPAEKPKKEEGVKGEVDAALASMEEAIEDVRTAVTEGGEKLVDIEVKVDEEHGKGEAETPVEAVTAALEVHALMSDAADELALISEALEGDNTNERVLQAAGQALVDTDAIFAHAATVLVAAKKDKDEKKEKAEKEKKEKAEKAEKAEKEKKEKDDKKKKEAGKIPPGLKAFQESKKDKGDKKEDKDDEKEDKKDEKEDKDDEKEEKEDKKDKKEAGKIPPGLKAFQDAKKGKGDDKEEKKEKDDDKEEKKDKKDEKEDKDDKKKDAQKLLDDALRLRAENRAMFLKKSEGIPVNLAPEDLEGADVNITDAPADDMLDEDPLANIDLLDDMLADDECGDGEDCLDADDDAEDFVIESEASVKEARRKDREELFSQGAEKILGKYELKLDKAQNATEPKYFDAHPGGKGTVTELSHTKTPEAKVETISEIHSVMRDVAESGPRNVREAAMAIQEGIVKGAFKAKDLERLVAEGKVDSTAAAYWKKYWSQGPDTGSFGADLSKEFAGKKKEASDQGYKVKLRRAYDLGLVAQEKNIIGHTRTALESYVDEVMNFDDAAFESVKRIVAGLNGDRKSGTLPRVGADAAQEAINVTASVESVPESNLVTQLSGIGWK